jgi:cyclophilin family peptidyl-prolyl cis-trans isomerase
MMMGGCVKRFLGLTSLLFALAGVAMAQEAPVVEPQSEVPQWTGPVVTLQTSMGDIEITLDTVGAPKTAAQFLGLVKSGHYDGAAFYRIEPGFLIQLGDLDAKDQYRAPKLPPVKLETATNHHSVGALGLAHADDPDSGQSTFYIDLADNSSLNADPDAPPNTTGYAAFGHVTAGMDVAEAIAAVELAPEGGPFPGKQPKVPVVVKKAVVAQDKAQ